MWLAALALALSTASAQQPAVEIPKGIVYKRASAEENRAARAFAEQQFGGSGTGFDADGFYGEVVIVGPFLWKRLEDEGTAKGVGSVSGFVIGAGNGKGYRLEGRTFSGPEQVRTVRQAFSKVVSKDEKFKLRAPTADELKVYWMMIPWDIEEPIYTMESDSHVLLMHFLHGAKQPNLFFVDDYTTVSKKR